MCIRDQYYYTLKIQCYYSNGISIKGDPSGRLVYTTQNPSFVSAYYEGANPYLVVSTSFPAPVITGQPQPSLGTGSPSQNPTMAFSPEPVNTGSGDYFYQHDDVTIPARASTLRFRRSYNSIDNYVGPLGINWNFEYNMSLTQTAGGIATI